MAAFFGMSETEFYSWVVLPILIFLARVAYVGMLIEDRLAIGTLIVRAIVPVGGEEVMRRLHDAGFGVTGVEGKGATGPVKLVHAVVKRKHIREVMDIIHNMHPKAFITVEDARSSLDGVFPSRKNLNKWVYLGRSMK